MSACPRTREDVEKTLDEAKIKTSWLNPATQILQFAEEEEAYTCLELNKDLLETLESGLSLVIRGDKNDNAVLCTNNKTYELKDTETSNSLLIMKNIKYHCDLKHLQETQAEGSVEVGIVDKLVHNYLEPRLCRPHLHLVRILLTKQLYKGPEHESSEASQDLYSFDRLLTTVQASEEEIFKELKDLHAVELKVHWRMLDFEYLFRVFSFITTFLEQESVPLDDISMELCCAAYEDIVPREVLEQVFKYYTEPRDDKPGFYSLRRDKVCRMVAESILKAARKFNLNEFLPVWQESVLPGLQTSLDQLTGIVIVEKESSPPAIWYFPERELPEDINERLQRLFQERPSWPLDDIVPYMEKLATPQLPVNALLAKYARMSSKDGMKYFTGRHSK